MTSITEQIIKDLESLPPTIQEETLDFIHFLKSKLENNNAEPSEKNPNGNKLVQLMKEASKKNLFEHIKDPLDWQRKIRKDRPLPGREK